MWPLARHLRRRGFDVWNWGYLSLLGRVEQYAERLSEVLLQAELESQGRQFHLVTHSMGGIIARTALLQHELSRLGRMVMLAPPNQGSFVARHLSPYLSWLAPTLEQLSDSPQSYVNQLGNPLRSRQLELGIIEASRDRVIAPGKVLLEGYCDLARVDGHHGILSWYPQTLGLVSSFLMEGRFQSATAEASGKPEFSTSRQGALPARGSYQGSRSPRSR